MRVQGSAGHNWRERVSLLWRAQSLQDHEMIAEPALGKDRNEDRSWGRRDMTDLGQGEEEVEQHMDRYKNANPPLTLPQSSMVGRHPNVYQRHLLLHHHNHHRPPPRVRLVE